jgi:multiple sugar transport system permease protein
MKAAALGRTVAPKTRTFRVKVFKERVWVFILYVLLTVGALPLLFPFAFMLSTSLKAKGEVLLLPIKWIPSHLMWQNYYQAMFGVMPLWRYMWNSVLVVAANQIGDVFICAVVGYAFARGRAPGKNILFAILLSTMMLPGHVVLVPTYVLFSMVHLRNTLWSLIVPGLFAGNAFFIFLFRQFFQTIHPELGDAAKIDGCSNWGVFGRVYLPLATSVLATVSVFSFFNNWNSFLWPLILIDDKEKLTLAVALKYFQGAHTTEFTLLMAASLIALVPCLILFFVAQRYLIQGIVVTGVKG